MILLYIAVSICASFCNDTIPEGFDFSIHNKGLRSRGRSSTRKNPNLALFLHRSLLLRRYLPNLPNSMYYGYLKK
ncbi:hypothetical protein F5878DRAFT_632216 [Lentinula raphanica]|uniref:Uncharacterized protein n=1 Tax=Lentinula raphanica TaxID=153919 RepID=A0AA38NZW9_9AGAR|nr:hypothetical protein F5878DRAFT_632216 [Lentinula raphanica]